MQEADKYTSCKAFWLKRNGLVVCLVTSLILFAIWIPRINQKDMFEAVLEREGEDEPILIAKFGLEEYTVVNLTNAIVDRKINF